MVIFISTFPNASYQVHILKVDLSFIGFKLAHYSDVYGVMGYSSTNVKRQTNNFDCSRKNITDSHTQYYLVL
ncbi:11660_t:CDS:2, partial [Funneliformis caledonium]